MGEIISVYEKNFNITDLKMIKPSVEIAEKHYILSSLIRKREGWKIPQNLS